MKKLENITETEIDNLLLGLLICTLKSDFESDTLDILGFEVEQKSGSDDPDFFQGGHQIFLLIYGMKPNFFFRLPPWKKSGLSEPEFFLEFETIQGAD